MPTLARPLLLVTRLWEQPGHGCGVRCYRCLLLSRITRVCARRCYARNVFNFSEPRNSIARMYVQPCTPRGGRYRGEYSGYNGCCEHLRFSACETSSSSTLNSLRDSRINGAGSGTNDRIEPNQDGISSRWKWRVNVPVSMLWPPVGVIRAREILRNKVSSFDKLR